MGLDFDQLYPGRFMKAGLFQGRDVTLEIEGVRLEELEGDKGKEVKGIITFKKAKAPKELTLNKTNGLCLKEMFGRDTANWIGKKVTLYPAEVDYENSDVAIRVRGSPDIPKDIEFTLKLARKKGRQVILKKTAVKGAAAVGGAKVAVPGPVPVEDPTPNPATGEVPFDDEPPADYESQVL